VFNGGNILGVYPLTIVTDLYKHDLSFPTEASLEHSRLTLSKDRSGDSTEARSAITMHLLNRLSPSESVIYMVDDWLVDPFHVIAPSLTGWLRPVVVVNDSGCYKKYLLPTP